MFDAPHAMRLEPGLITLVNIGRGPAINLHFVFRERSDSPAGWRDSYPTEISHLREGHSLQSHKTAESAVGSLVLTASYESLSGQTYQTRATFEDRVLKQFEYPKIGER